MKAYDPVQCGWSDGYLNREPNPPALFEDDYWHGYDLGQKERDEKDAWIAGLAVEMALTQDARRRAS
jgi:hypothetical protein